MNLKKKVLGCKHVCTTEIKQIGSLIISDFFKDNFKFNLCKIRSSVSSVSMFAKKGGIPMRKQKRKEVEMWKHNVAQDVKGLTPYGS